MVNFKNIQLTPEKELKPQSQKLIGAILHRGATAENSHYVAYVRKNGSWFLCDDNDVRRIHFSQEKNNIAKEATILFYENESA